MKTYTLKQTTLTPKIDFNAENGKMSIYGNSVFFDTNNFWEEVITWYKLYLLNPNAKTELRIELEYFNSISAKFLYRFLKMNKYILQMGLIITINWVVLSDDKDMLDIVQMMKKESGLPIEIQLLESKEFAF